MCRKVPASTPSQISISLLILSFILLCYCLSIVDHYLIAPFRFITPQRKATHDTQSELYNTAPSSLLLFSLPPLPLSILPLLLFCPLSFIFSSPPLLSSYILFSPLLSPLSSPSSLILTLTIATGMPPEGFIFINDCGLSP